jgi:uncharacterized membrane protein (DUF2068 family)
MYEICRHPDLIRVGVLVVNLLVLAYLTWSLRRRLRRAEQVPEQSEFDDRP